MTSQQQRVMLLEFAMLAVVLSALLALNGGCT